MNSSENEFDAADDLGSLPEEGEQDEQQALEPSELAVDGPDTFAGDRGELPLQTRRVLVQLLQGPAVDGRRQSKLWPVLIRDEAVLRSRLHELFLELVIDAEQKVAFTRQVVADDIDAPVLLRRATLTFLESALILHLRQRLTQADAQGERAVVSKSELIEHLRVYERDRNVDHARFERQLEGAVEKAKKLSLLHKLRGSDERFEVSPTLKLLFSPEQIQALTRTYEALAHAASPQGGDTEPSEDAAVPDSVHCDEPTEQPRQALQWGAAPADDPAASENGDR